MGKKYPATQRTYGGKRYTLWTTFSYKRMAEIVARDVREKGDLARVAKTPDGWSVYKYWRKPGR